MMQGSAALESEMIDFYVSHVTRPGELWLLVDVQSQRPSVGAVVAFQTRLVQSLNEERPRITDTVRKLPSECPILVHEFIL